MVSGEEGADGRLRMVSGEEGRKMLQKIVVGLVVVAVAAGLWAVLQKGSGEEVSAGSNPPDVRAVLLTGEELAPYTVEREVNAAWWDGTEQGNPGIRQTVSALGRPYLLIKASRFDDSATAVEAVRFHVTDVAMVFYEGLPDGNKVGEACWYTPKSGWQGFTVVFQQGPYCVLVGSPLAENETHGRAVLDIARKISEKIARRGKPLRFPLTPQGPTR